MSLFLFLSFFLPPISSHFTAQGLCLLQTCSVAVSTVMGALQAASEAAAAFSTGRPGQRALVSSSMQQQCLSGRCGLT